MVYTCSRKSLPDGPSPLTHKGRETVLIDEDPNSKAENQTPQDLGERQGDGRHWVKRWGGVRGLHWGCATLQQLTKKKRLKTKRRYLTRLRQLPWADIF